jgi:hypothetical protein
MEGKKQAGQSTPLPGMEDAMPDGPAELQAIALKLHRTTKEIKTLTDSKKDCLEQLKWGMEERQLKEFRMEIDGIRRIVKFTSKTDLKIEEVKTDKQQKAANKRAFKQDDPNME